MELELDSGSKLNTSIGNLVLKNENYKKMFPLGSILELRFKLLEDS